jgi:hypothetical protein
MVEDYYFLLQRTSGWRLSALRHSILFCSFFFLFFLESSPDAEMKMLFTLSKECKEHYKTMLSPQMAQLVDETHSLDCWTESTAFSL